VYSGWTAQFESDPTYTRGAPDGTAAGWQFINPAYPMASHPDQVWINGSPVAQVATRAQVGPGKFYVDYSTHELVLGSDPTGQQVRASDLGGAALTATAPGTVIRGIGFMRFATSVPNIGTLRMWGSHVTAENVIVQYNANQGIALTGTGITFRKVTSSDNGLAGFSGGKSDGLVLDRVRAERDNSEHFNAAPVAAGIKMSTSRGVLIENSVFSKNYANGIWFDVSCYDVKLINNDVIGNTDDGVIWELSEKLYMVNNRLIDNGGQGLFFLDAGLANIWNNTITGSPVPVRFHDTNRNAADLNSAPYGYDNRQPKPDPTVTWVVYGITFRNNIVGGGVGGWCGVLCVLNSTDTRTASQMVSLDGDVYERSSASSPSALVRWATATTGATTNYPSLSVFKMAIANQEVHGAEVVGAGAGAVPSSLPRAGVAMPSDVATVLGVATGTTYVGAMR
jgi:trimeric autotransporter adhesin